MLGVWTMTEPLKRLIPAPVTGTHVVTSDPRVIVVDGFFTANYVRLMQDTQDLGEGDTLHIISQGPGGNAFVVLAMMNYLEDLKAKGVCIITEVGGMAASANALIWVMGDERVVHDGDLIMFHEAVVMGPYGAITSEENYTKAQHKIMDNLNGYMRAQLMEILNDKEVVDELMDPTIDEDKNMNWFTAKELFNMGVATKFIAVY